MDTIRIALTTTEPLSLAGMARCVRRCPGLAIVPDHARMTAQVQVICARRFSAQTLAAVRRLRAATDTRAALMLVIGRVEESLVSELVELRPAVVLPRALATPEQLTRCVVTAASGEREDLLAEVPRAGSGSGPGSAALTARESDIVQLLADGLDTSEVAARLGYSERTVKNVAFRLTRRLGLRNRPHLVAYALRAGVI